MIAGAGSGGGASDAKAAPVTIHGDLTDTFSASCDQLKSYELYGVNLTFLNAWGTVIGTTQAGDATEAASGDGRTASALTASSFPSWPSTRHACLAARDTKQVLPGAWRPPVLYGTSKEPGGYPTKSVMSCSNSPAESLIPRVSSISFRKVRSVRDEPAVSRSRTASRATHPSSPAPDSNSDLAMS